MVDLVSQYGWHQPVQVSFGAGCLDGMAEALEGRRAIVVAFPHARGAGIQDRLVRVLGERLSAWIDCPDDIASLTRAQWLCAQVWPLLARQPDTVLIGLGGGTVLDLCKVARCRPPDADAGSVSAALRGESPWPDMAVAPLWLVPTTAGTGSEVTRWATIWDTEAVPHAKLSLDAPFGYAQRAWVDPTTTLSCPTSVIRDSGVDALAHALEAIWNRHANPVSDALAVSAARAILQSLPAAMSRPEDLSVRTLLSQAALQAGLAFSQTRTALAHALSYPLTLDQGLPHGSAVGVWLPTTWALAFGHCSRVDALLGEVLAGGACDGADQLAAWLHRVGARAYPAEVDIRDSTQRILEALGSVRGRNFIAVPPKVVGVRS